MAEEYGPWIEHDGAGLHLPDGTWFQYRAVGFGLAPKDGCHIDARQHPSFFWRWRRVREGWFGSKLVRVCDDPAYAPIVAYRIRKPRGLLILLEIAANPPADEIKERRPERVLP